MIQLPGAPPKTPKGQADDERLGFSGGWSVFLGRS